MVIVNRHFDPTGALPVQTQMKASVFKARCLRLMDEVAESGDSIVITKNGTPVARLVPYRRRPATLFAAQQGAVTILGDIEDPIDVAWDANP